MHFLKIKTNRKQFLTRFENRTFSSLSIKKILIWNPFLREDVRKGFRTCLANCEFKCEVSEDKDDVSNADAIIFHAYDLWPVFMHWILKTPPSVEFPSFRHPEQVWILFNKEPPCNIFWDATLFNGLFNWTAWYRRDATVWWPYGSKYVVNELKDDNHGSSYDRNQTSFKDKPRGIAGMISNCVDQAQRYKLVYELQKYLKIDMFGHCYNNPCGNMKTPKEKTCEDILRKYKFYLAFENSHCKDYVSEKYWESLNRNQIPIVNWKVKQDDIAIPGSYINIYHFKDVMSFSEYITEVMNNETLYKTYFKWKSRYAFREPCVTCEICRLLRDRTMKAQVYHDLGGWIKGDYCPKFSILSQILKHLYWTLFWTFGIDIEQT